MNVLLFVADYLTDREYYICSLQGKIVYIFTFASDTASCLNEEYNTYYFMHCNYFIFLPINIQPTQINIKIDQLRWLQLHEKNIL